MSEHTPGPWKVDSKYCVGPVSQEDDQSYGMIIPVADVYGQNRQADAGLIASAPQLREQNRVLATKLDEVAVLAKEIKDEFDGCTHECERCGESDPMTTFDIYRTVVKLAALTATSQEGQG